MAKLTAEEKEDLKAIENVHIIYCNVLKYYSVELEQRIKFVLLSSYMAELKEIRDQQVLLKDENPMPEEEKMRILRRYFNSPLTFERPTWLKPVEKRGPNWKRKVYNCIMSELEILSAFPVCFPNFKKEKEDTDEYAAAAKIIHIKKEKEDNDKYGVAAKVIDVKKVHIKKEKDDNHEYGVAPKKIDIKKVKLEYEKKGILSPHENNRQHILKQNLSKDERKKKRQKIMHRWKKQ